MQRSRNILKGWFETGDIPTQEQFWDLIDSVFNLFEDSLPINKVVNLQNLLNAKADYEALQNHLLSENPHGVTKAQVGLSNLPNAKSDAIDQNNSDQLATSAAVYQLASMIAAMNSVVEEVFETDASFTVLFKSLLENVVIIPSADIDLRIGLTPGGQELQPTLTYVANQPVFVPMGIYSNTGDTDIYFTGITSPTTIIFYNK